MDTKPPSAPDDGAIPVSSLRSKFEKLTNDPQVGASIPPRPAAHNFHLRPVQDGASLSGFPLRKSLDAPRPMSIAHAPVDMACHDDPPSLPQKRRPSPPGPRPRSMLPATPGQPPPVFHIDSPKSPPKHFDVHVTNPTPTMSPPTPSSSATGSPVASARHSRTPSRVATPALEARMSAYLQASSSNEHLLDHFDKAEQKPTNQASAPPPPVNRAGKPRLSSPSLATAGRLDPLAQSTPQQHDHVSTGKQVSPFTSPPSTSDATFADLIPPVIPTDTKPRMPAIGSSKQPYSPVVAPRRGTRETHTHSPVPQTPATFSRLHLSSSFGRLPAADGTEDLPSLPPRPVAEPIPGRTSPVRQQRIPARGSMDIPRRSSLVVAEQAPLQFMPPPRRITTQSALLQGFDRQTALPSQPIPQKPQPPAIPAPRRSADTRREDVKIPSSTSKFNEHMPVIDHNDSPAMPHANLPVPQDFPDSSQTNRQPPHPKLRPWEIATGYDTRLFAVCGEFVCTTGYITRVWSLRTGESCLTLAHGENVKVTALVFKPTPDAADEGKRLWLGTSIGEIHEVDIPSQSVVHTKPNAHPRREIIKMFRYASELWSLDDEGRLHIWPAGSNGMPSLESTPRAFRLPRGHSCSIVAASLLWFAAGKEIRVFQPSAVSEASFQVLQRPLIQESAGDVTSAAIISSKPDLIYFGHADGKVSTYSIPDFKCLSVVNVSPYKISSLAAAGDYLWAGYNTGMIYIYDTSTVPWRVTKDWRAHHNPVCSILADQQSIWKMDRLQVISLGLDNALKMWDGLLKDDWLETQMQVHDAEFCTFEELSAAVLTWNAGATKPNFLRNDEKDSNFFREYLLSHNSPDIFVFGFQELVDLEDKKMTAKSFFKSKKKDPTEQEHMSHQYRAWRDHLTRCIEDFMPTNQPYSLLHTASMVGLFSCVFVKSSIRSRIKHVHTAEIKRGMGGLHGSKGALVLRMTLDDSSICLINCHLAAGQSQTINRNNDVAAILETGCLPVLGSDNVDGTFVGGGDGSMILDHEICILNGDLNYRIDAMPRDTVVRAVRDNNLPKLLERDQLLLSRRKNPGFRLRVFQELPITFAPTYKYNVGTDEYDTSEKKRVPAWCDRVLFRGLDRIKCEDYRRWEIRVSDHRPVSARFRIKIKRVDEQKRKKAWDLREREYERFKERIAGEAKLDYLTNVLGLQTKEALSLLKN